MWLAGRHKRILQSAIACSLLVILGAHAEENDEGPDTEVITPGIQIPSDPEITPPSGIEIPSDIEIPSGAEITPRPDTPQEPMIFTGNRFSNQFEELLEERVALNRNKLGCPVLVSVTPEGDWIIDDFGVDFVTFIEADGANAISYPIGRLCLWTETDE